MSEIQTKQSNPMATMNSLIESMKPQMLRVLPKHLSADRMARIALTELRKTPRLLQCSPESFCGAIMACSELGLEPGSSLGQIYLIPYGNVVQVILGYKGMIELARRSGSVVSICAREVHANDHFDLKYGLEEKLEHTPKLVDRGELIAVYAVAHFVGGGHQIEVMSKEDIDKIRGRSKSNGQSPWQSDYNEMAKKTVVRKMFKYLPVSIEKIQMATSLDEQAEYGQQDMKELFKSSAEEEIIMETGEVKSQSDELMNELKGK